MIDKAVILAAGAGTRMRRRDASSVLTKEQASQATSGVKAMIPIGRPFLDYVLANVADAGYRRVCLVIGPGHGAIRDYYEGLNSGRLEFDFAIQATPEGTADAVAAAAAFVADDPFLVLNSDNYYPTDVLRCLRNIQGSALAGFSRRALLEGSNIAADRIAKFSVIEVDTTGNLHRIVEKPAPALVAAMPEPVFISMNCWRFQPAIFDACRSIERSPRGEYELPDAVMHSIARRSVPYRVVASELPVLDLSTRGDIAAVANRLAGTEVDL